MSSASAYGAQVAALQERFLLDVPDAREVWLVRHAEADVNHRTEDGESRAGPPLSVRGRDQAARLAERLARVPLHALWSSDLERARATAEAVGCARGLEVRVDPRLGEVRPYWVSADDNGAGADGPLRAAISDVVAALEGTTATRPRALVVSHNAAMVIYLAGLLGLDWRRFPLLPHHTSVSVLAFMDGRVVVQSIADATHLVPLD